VSNTQDHPADIPAQSQDQQPGREHEMTPAPDTISPDWRGSGKLDGKVALVTGGDSGIGRAVAVLFAREGADVAVVYLDEDEDAAETQRLVEREGRRCLTVSADVQDEGACRDAVSRTVAELGGINVLVNNAAWQRPQQSLGDISADQLDRTFRTNIFAYFYLAKAALPHMAEGDAIVNSCSVLAFQGSGGLLDYASTKGAIVTFTRSLAQNEEVVEKGVRVNSVAPGPIWTPLIPATMEADKVEDFGSETTMGRAGQPAELAPAYLYLAAPLMSSYVTGQTVHVNGGTVVGA
jgi:NAD(P)-dependent dehydrogenase (short-subunit alcohol dehydrogenase family)